MKQLERIAVVVPAWQPEARLIALVESLQAAGFGSVLVVDDGSGAAFAPVFEQVGAAGARLLRHAVNLGKGRALKTAYNSVLVEHPEIDAVVTADADGQHRVEDIVRVALVLQCSAGRAVLGSRALEHDVPWRSKVGNLLTRRLFEQMTGSRLRDTQSGLRGFPVSMLPRLMMLAGEGYEYEMNVLAHLCRAGIRPIEVPIETVYFEGNRATRFHPVWDSLRVYGVLARLWWSAAR